MKIKLGHGWKLGGGKPQWRAKEPENRTDPVRHEIFAQSRVGHHRLLLAASIRGKKSAHIGKWREDAVCWERVGPFTLLSLADGAGAFDLSRVGAQLACTVSISRLKAALGPYVHGDDPACSAAFLKQTVKRSMLDAIDAIAREAEKRDTDPRSLSTTLMVIVFRDWKDQSQVVTAQIGDGVISLLKGPSSPVVLGMPDYGEYGGESRFLTSKGIGEAIDRRLNFTVLEDIRCLAAMTDGIADDFYPFDPGLDFFFQQVFKRILGKRNPLKALKKWIRYETVGSYDDRSLILIGSGKVKGEP